MLHRLLYFSHSLQAFSLVKTIQLNMLDQCKISGAQWLTANLSSATFLATLPWTRSLTLYLS